MHAVIDTGETYAAYYDYHELVERLEAFFGKIREKIFIPKIAIDIMVKKVYSSWQQYIGFISGKGNECQTLAKRSLNTAILTAAITTGLSLFEHQRLQIVEGALFHDIGMLHIPDTILDKPESLSEAEQQYITVHPLYGYKILEEALWPDAKKLGPIILQHHERWDGTGYPQGLAGLDIDLGARVVSVADAYAAMVSQKVYRDAMSGYQAMYTLLSNDVSCFDPAILRVFVRSMGICPVGSIVQLNNGAVAQVVEPDENAFLRPRIRILIDQWGNRCTDENSETIKLSMEKTLSIVKTFTPGELAEIT
ncbi:MAG: HD-GYP domain-containing protein [Treponema sp.]|jgi:HD-GYP domain-containing protein (c-di-GMP phosphodiesterase class II)|nr:HD-GYP domain-containing protein [Treponema sp.]